MQLLIPMQSLYKKGKSVSRWKRVTTGWKGNHHSPTSGRKNTAVPLDFWWSFYCFQMTVKEALQMLKNMMEEWGVIGNWLKTRVV